jgi:uncharacterized protein (TIGR00299 family) protein
MRAAYLECFSGISGDMLLGALLEIGVSEELLRGTISSLNLGVELRVRRAERSGICGTKVDVIVDDALADADHFHGHHRHDAATLNTYPSQPHGRSLSAIREILARANILDPARQTAVRAFELLGEAEAAIHNVPIENVHFHEVGAEDTIVDIVCAAVGCHALGVDAFVCSPLNLGGGIVNCAHGEFPVPAPATLALLKGVPVYSSGANAELVTPTGAALIRALGCRFSEFPRMCLHAVGYGAGSYNLEGRPNVLRVSTGELIEHKSANSFDTGYETVTVLETTIDDLSPQVMGYVTERLLAEGAFDVFVIPAQMKKNRLGSLLTVLCQEEIAQRMREIIFAETSTIGIRTRPERRDCLERETIPITTQWGTIRMKQSRLNGHITHFAPEYEDCRRAAQEHSVALKQVQQEAIGNYLAQTRDVHPSGACKEPRSQHDQSSERVA